MQNAFRVAAVTNKEISKLIKQAVSEIYEEGDEVQGESFNRQSFVFFTLFIDKTSEKVFCLQMQIKIKSWFPLFS